MRLLKADARRQERLLEINSLLVTAPEPRAARSRILECIVEELGEGMDEAGERHVTVLCTLLASAETQRLTAQTERELADMFDLYHRLRRELREAEYAEHAAGILARSVVPVLADVCLVDLTEGSDEFRRAAVETSHLVLNASPIKEALANPPDRCCVPHDPRVVARTGNPRLLSDVTDDDLVRASSTPEHLQALRSLKPTSYLCVPLGSSNASTGPAAGVMTLLRVRSERAFTDPHKRLAQALGEAYHDAAPVRPEAPRNGGFLPAPSPVGNGANGRGPASASRVGYDLTRRELEVLGLINRGYSREDLARRLNISVRTYDNHTSSIRAKLNAPNNVAALAKARRAGIDLDD